MVRIRVVLLVDIISKSRREVWLLMKVTSTQRLVGYSCSEHMDKHSVSEAL
jgi:hypothetical protein